MDKSVVKSKFDDYMTGNRICLERYELDEFSKLLKGECQKGRLQPSLGCPMIMQGMQSFVSPVDGEVVTNRKELTEHNKRNGVHQVGDDHEKKYNENKTERLENGK